MINKNLAVISILSVISLLYLVSKQKSSNEVKQSFQQYQNEKVTDSAFLPLMQQYQDPTFQKIIQNVTSIMEGISSAYDQLGVAVALFVDGMGYYQNAVGYDSLSRTRKMTPDDHYRVGSITKTFTAAAILQLIQQNKMSFNDTLQHHIPEVAFPYAENITIFMLLHHTSGLAEYTSVLLPDVQSNWTLQMSPLQLMNYSLQYPPMFLPGTNWMYCNTNYLILGEIIQRVAGEPFKNHIEKKFHQYMLFNSYVDDAQTTLEAPFAHGYMTYNGTVYDTSTMNPSVFFGCGEVVSTVNDLLVWAGQLYSGNVLGRDQSSMDMLFSFVDTNAMFQNMGALKYGSGVFLMEDDIVGHPGDVPGYSSLMFRGQADNITLVMFGPQPEIGKQGPMIINNIRNILNP